MVDVLTEVTINKPIKEVYQYASNPDNAPEWYKNIETAEWKTPKPLTVGSKVAFVAQFMGRKLSYTYEFTRVDIEQLVMRTAEGPFPMETTYTWTLIDEKTTKMSLRNRGNPTGFSKFFIPFMTIMMKKANSKDLINIKRILEDKKESQ